MKQHITSKQVLELSDKAREKLKKWWKPKKGDLIVNITEINKNFLKACNITEQVFVTTEELVAGGINAKTQYPLLSVGQMIEFLEQYDSHKLDFAIHSWQEYAGDSKELVDYLWEAVKEILDELNKI